METEWRSSFCFIRMPLVSFIAQASWRPSLSPLPTPNSLPLRFFMQYVQSGASILPQSHLHPSLTSPKSTQVRFQIASFPPCSAALDEIFTLKHRLKEDRPDSFAEEQAKLSKDGAEHLTLTGQDLFQVLQANVIISWYYYSHAK